MRWVQQPRTPSQKMMERNRNQPQLPRVLSSPRVKCQRKVALIRLLGSIFTFFLSQCILYLPNVAHCLSLFSLIITCLHWSTDKAQCRWSHETRKLVFIAVFLALTWRTQKCIKHQYYVDYFTFNCYSNAWTKPICFYRLWSGSIGHSWQQ